MKKFLASLMVAAMAMYSAPVEVRAESQPAGEKIKVMTSFNPINELVRTIGGDKVETEMIVAPGVEPHDFEPTPQDLIKVQESKILFINGLEMEPWAEEIEGPKVIDLSEGVDKISLHEGHDQASNSSDADHEHEASSNATDHDHDHETASNTEEHSHEGHNHGEYDPHIWLGLKELKVMAENTYKGLSEIDPANAEYYKTNLDKFIADVDALDKEFAPQFAEMKVKSFVTGHEAFGYLCRNAGLEQKAVVGVFGEGEPTPQQISDLVEFVKSENITTIFVENGQSPEVSETVAQETGAKTVEIGTLETEGEIIPTIRDIYTKIIEASKN